MRFNIGEISFKYSLKRRNYAQMYFIPTSARLSISVRTNKRTKHGGILLTGKNLEVCDVREIAVYHTVCICRIKCTRPVQRDLKIAFSAERDECAALVVNGNTNVKHALRSNLKDTGHTHANPHYIYK